MSNAGAGSAPAGTSPRAGRNMELMQTLDDAWNAQDTTVSGSRHRPDVVVTWPGKPPTPARPTWRWSTC